MKIRVLPKIPIMTVLLSLLLSSCSLAPKATKLLMSVEERSITEDIITEYRVFESGLVNITVKHNSGAAESEEDKYLFASSFKNLTAAQTEQAKVFAAELKELDYKNSFPWKEDFYKRGDVIKFEFADEFKPKLFDKSAEAEELAMAKTFIYYTGHEDSPELFKQIMELLH